MTPEMQTMTRLAEALERKQAELNKCKAALRVALARLDAIAWPSAETTKVITTIKEAL